MSEVTMVFDEKEIWGFLKKNDIRDKYGDEDNFWLNLNQNIEELTFNDGFIDISFSNDSDAKEPYLSLHIPIAEFIEAFEKFDTAKEADEYVFKTAQRSRKILELIEKIKNKRQEELEKWKAELTQPRKEKAKK